MTLSISWIRRVGNTEEIIVASDSRLRFACAWDSCPKILILSRGDCILSFKGDTQYAYPMMQQVANSINMYPKLNSRALDITETRGHICRVITKMRKYIHDKGVTRNFIPQPPDTSFILSGYSWKFSRYYIWELKFKERSNSFEHHTPQTIMKNKIAIIVDASNKGDPNSHITEKSVRKRIYELMKSKGKDTGDDFDMEPFEILRDIIRNEEDFAIGGPIQMAKIYKHMNTMPFAVYWPNKCNGEITFLGRQLLDYEFVPYLILDPDTFKTYSMKVVNQEIARVWDDGKYNNQYTP